LSEARGGGMQEVSVVIDPDERTPRGRFSNSLIFSLMAGNSA